ncbi:MAG: hypothetical protein R2778_11510 [Saprospiraceae bacterium]
MTQDFQNVALQIALDQNWLMTFAFPARRLLEFPQRKIWGYSQQKTWNPGNMPLLVHPRKERREHFGVIGFNIDHDDDLYQ